MARTLEELVIKLSADNAELRSKLNQSQREISGFSSKAGRDFDRLSASLKTFAATFGVAFAVDKLRQFTSAALELGSSLNDASQRLGTTAEALQVYRLQAAEAGVSTDTTDSSIQSFSKTLGQLQAGIGRATKQLQALDPALLANLRTAGSVDEAYRLVADAVKAAADAGDQQKAAAIAAATGMAPLLGVLKDGADAFDTFSEKARASGLILSNEASKSLDAFGESLDRVSNTFLVGFAEGLAKATDETGAFTTALSSPETLKSINELGAGLAHLVNLLADFVNWSAEASRSPLWRGAAQSIFGKWAVPDVSRGASGSWGGGVDDATRARMAAALGFDATGNPLRFPGAQSAPARTGRVGGGGRRISAGSIPSDFVGFPIVDPTQIVSQQALDESFRQIDDTFQEIDDAISKHFDAMEQRAQDFGDFLGDVIARFVTSGKLDFAELGKSFLAEIVKMQVSALASGLFKSVSGGSAGGILGAGLSAIGSLFGAHAEGGLVTRPHIGLVGEKGPELIVPLNKLGGFGGVTVNVHNYGGSDVQVAQSRLGGKIAIDVMVDASMKRNRSSGRSRAFYGDVHRPGIG